MIEVFNINWPAEKNVHALTTTRHGGISTGKYRGLNLGDHVDDEQAAVEYNRKRLKTDLNLPAEPKWLNQVHGVNIVNADDLSGVVDADGSYATKSNCVCAILTADCLPVFISNTQGTAVGLFHAGWRGLANGILSKAVTTMSAHSDCLIAAIGPAISHQSFEVGSDVKAIFNSRYSDVSDFFHRSKRRNHYYADLYGLAETQLYQQGVKSVWLPGSVCTYKDEKRFFSYRRDGQTGRMASLVWIS